MIKAVWETQQAASSSREPESRQQAAGVRSQSQQSEECPKWAIPPELAVKEQGRTGERETRHPGQHSPTKSPRTHKIILPHLKNLPNSLTTLGSGSSTSSCEQTKCQIALELHVSIENSGANLASKKLLTISLSKLFEWSIPGTFFTECINLFYQTRRNPAYED